MYVTDLYKARPHKYIKRERRGDKWVYWYKLPDGRIVSSEGDEQKQKGATQEHVQRLVAGRLLGVHNMRTREIASEVGMTTRQVDSKVANFYKKGKKKLKREGRSEEEIRSMPRKDVAKMGAEVSGFHYEELKEAMARPDRKNAEQMEEYERRARAIEEILYGRGEREDAPTETPTPEPEAETPEVSENLRDVSFEQEAEPESETPTPKREQSTEQLIARLEELGITLDEPEAEADEPESEAEAEALEEVPSTSYVPIATEENLDDLEEAIDEYTGRRPDLSEDEEEEVKPRFVQINGREAVIFERRNESATDMDSTDSIENADPEFAEADAPIQEMIREQEQGGNPYLRKATEVFERIQNDLKPERQTKIRHMLESLDAYRFDQSVITGDENYGYDAKGMTKEQKEAKLLEIYNRISGRRVRSLGSIGKEFERGTFMTLDEALHNPPIDVEVQRMKRGYPMKQYMRMKPMLKSSFLEANPSAPPPYPTFGDLKTGNAQGVAPSAGPNNRTMMPESVYNALPKDTRGNAIIPPAWCPIHLMPAWNYMVKKEEKKQGGRLDVTQRRTRDQLYANRPELIERNQATYDNNLRRVIDGNFVNVLRKFVRMRGEGNLVDIPKSSLTASNLTHDELFRADGDIETIIRTKIIDNVALIPFIKEEMKNMKKSFSLYVDLETPAFKKSDDEEKELRKSLIKKIREIRCQNEKKNFFVPNAIRK